MSFASRLAAITRAAVSAIRPPWVGMGPRTIREPYTGAWQRGRSIAAPDLTAFSAVYACASILSGDIAKLPLILIRTNEDGTKEPARNHPAARLLRRPNPSQTGLEFVQQLLLSTLLTGNGYALLSRDGRGVVSEMRVLDPQKVAVYVTEDGSAAYRVGDDPWSGVKVQEMFPERDVLHVRINPIGHPLVGVSPLYAAAASAAGGAAILESGAAFFTNRAVPAGQIVTPNKIDTAVAKQLAAQWQAAHGDGNQGRVAVLGGGMEWKPLTMTATDAQLVEQLRFSVEDVARVFRVPLFMLGDLTKVSYRNAEQLARLYYSGALQYLMENVEARLDLALDLASDLGTEFDLAPLFRLETDARFTSYETALRAGWLSINEVRRREGLRPVPGGEEPRVQMQYVPLSVAEAGGSGGATPPNSSGPGAASDEEGPGDDPGDASGNAAEEEAAT